MSSNEPYRIGALADLISAQSNTSIGEKKAKFKLEDLFSSRLPSLPQNEEVCKSLSKDDSEKKKKTKNGVGISEPSVPDERSDRKRKTSTVKTADNLQVKKRKESTKQGVSNKTSKSSFKEEEEDSDAEPPEYAKPSLKYQVRMEDSKERIYDEEKESRTVFVGNLSADVTKKTIRKIFRQFGNIETVRFRGAARPDLKTTKRVAVIKRHLNENHQRINAYVRFASVSEAKKSLALNGTEINGTTMRLDIASASAADHDQSKAVFVGNLPFAIEEDDLRGHFECCGKIVSVRLVRDSSTGMGKGFGYVNFTSADGVEMALHRNETELLGRKIRVTRAVRKPKATLNLAEKVKKWKLGKSNQKSVLVNKKVVKIGKKKQREAKEASFQGQTATGSSIQDGKLSKKKKKNKGEFNRKKIAAKFSKV